MNSEVAYCLLAEIKSRRSNISSLIEVFQEMVESLFTYYYKKGDIKEQLTDLRTSYIKAYGIEIPFPTLKIILSRLKEKYKDAVTLYSDFSYSIAEGTIENSSQNIKQSENDIDELNKLYEKYCGISKKDCKDLYEFIEQSKKELITFVRNPQGFSPDGWDQSVVDFINLIFGLSKYRQTFEKLLMGSIISSYFDVKIDDAVITKTLLLDTNFLVSLMDLHSDDSYITTDTILKLSQRAGYKVQVLPETIKETRNLLEKKAEKIEKVNIFSSQKKHTIEGGCARRKISRSELLVYAERIETFLEGRDIEVISEEVNNKLLQDLENTDIYKNLMKRPFNIEGVPHDAVAMNYIKSIRNPSARNISEVNAFFVTDTIGFMENKITQHTRLPYAIRAEELLNILWLANPILDSSILISNIARMMTLHLDKKLPDKDMLRRIDEKIEKFADLGLDKEACAELALNVAEIDTKQLNALLDIDEKEQFNEKLLEMAIDAKKSRDEKEKQRIKEYDELLIFLEEEKQIEKGEALAAMEKSISDMKSEYDDFARLREKEHIDELLIRDAEALKNINETIFDLTELIRKRERLIFTPFVLLSVAGIIAFILNNVIPDWQNTEPFIYIIELIPLIITAVIYIITGKTIKFSESISNIKKIINRRNLYKLHNKESDKNNIEERIRNLKRKKDSIID
ncbi:MAG: hypothetical protein AMQ22_02148 [Candidatus Methanofastidiosum methylothiophilum]|jgi:hypothetical protein|uniref:Uncharacterized protein n=1 Tax=Candidatus Methanofastidiosum methylothiophilum TaxID=1705564 RepID=A0A150IN25_9EURY|nr:MAG: hypothetical protein AMQ22_02148 [Candidatus Methanofastidiosum methylthiophilus]